MMDKYNVIIHTAAMTPKAESRSDEQTPGATK
jgi:hypothetical protein